MLKNNGEKGLSLVEGIIGGAIAVGVGLGVTKMSVNTNKSVKHSERNLEIVSLMAEARTILSDPAACKNSFGSLKANNNVVTQIKNAKGVVVFENGKPYGSSGLAIKSMRLDDSDPAVTVNSNALGTTNFIMTFDRKNSLGVKIIDKKIRLSVNTINTDEVDTCYAFSSGNSSIWTRDTTIPDNIYYNSGNVGIGIVNPTSQLYVKGNTANPHTRAIFDAPSSAYASYISLWNAGVKEWSVGQNPIWSRGNHDFYIYKSGTYTAGKPEITGLVFQTSTGNMGVGNIDPKGQIHVKGSTTEPHTRIILDAPNNSYASYMTLWDAGVKKWSVGQNPSWSRGSHDFYIYQSGTLSGSNMHGVSIKTSNGFVGLGTTNPTQKLDVNGNIAVAGTTVHTSDRRLKTEIRSLGNSLSKITKLKAVEYFWKDRGFDKKKQYGFIADEVLKVFPNLVYQNTHDDFLSVNYLGLIAPLVEAVKEQNKKVQKFENEVKLLKVILCKRFPAEALCDQ